MNNQNISEVDCLNESHDAMGNVQRAIKRFLDVVFSVAGMIILSPLYLVIAIMLKRQKNGPVIFSQEKEPQLVAKCQKGQSTKTEMFLREHHLDELPQLWNVLKGDMSFVGPRPERKFYIDKIMERDPSYNLIYEMKPGLTSEATIYNGYTDTMEKMLVRLHMDTDYLKKRSLMLDASIVMKTFFSIVSGKKF